LPFFLGVLSVAIGFMLADLLQEFTSARTHTHFY
jgi:hypothetical protein